MRPSEAKHVLSRLVAAFPSMPMDEATAVVYAEALVRFDVDVALFAARDWIDSNDRFPTINQFMDYCQREARRQALQATSQRPECGECDHGWVNVTNRPHSVRPCEVCRPGQYVLWADGHWDRKHVSGGGCNDCRPTRGKR